MPHSSHLKKFALTCNTYPHAVYLVNFSVNSLYFQSELKYQIILSRPLRQEKTLLKQHLITSYVFSSQHLTVFNSIFIYVTFIFSLLNSVLHVVRELYWFVTFMCLVLSTMFDKSMTNSYFKGSEPQILCQVKQSMWLHWGSLKCNVYPDSPENLLKCRFWFCGSGVSESYDSAFPTSL